MTRSRREPSKRQPQRGFAPLAVTLLLFFTMVLVAAYANRGLLFEQRASAHQYRAAQALEAAEAGLEWALAQLNDSQRVDDRCLPSTIATDSSFRERFIRTHPDTGLQEPVAWMSGGLPVALQPGCVHGDSGWSCSCPSSGHPSLDAVDHGDGAPHPAYSVQFIADAQPGLVRITSTGCSSASGPCRPGADDRTDASVRLQVVLGLLPGLATAPQAPLTVQGSVDVGTAALGLHNPDGASGGITLRAGGNLIGTAVRLTTAPGGVVGASAWTHDPMLASIEADRLFSTHFSLDKASWKNHAAVQAMPCADECAARVAAAIGRAAGNRMISITGDARFDGPVTLGAPDRPVVIVVDGRVTLTGGVTLHGLLYAADVRWDDTAGSPAGVHGAVISESTYRGNGAPDLHRDAAVLRALQLNTGSYARVPGSWKDF